MSKSKGLSIAAGIFGGWGGGGVLWSAVSDHETTAVVVSGCYLVMLVAAVIGMWKEHGWAVWTGRTLAAMALVFGVYLAHFVWTFWIFQEPTLRDRVLAVLQPRVSFYILFPVLWLLFSWIPVPEPKKKGM